MTLTWLVVATVVAGMGQASAQTQPAPTPALARPAGVSGTVVVPDHFLRRWDPVTVFFAADAGPATGGPEDRPDRVVRMEPNHPGAWTWLDARTLQFRPAEPWPPLGQFVVTVGGTRQPLMTLMSAPTSSLPANGAEGLEPVDGITLTFPEPLDEAALARMVRIELRPLPGVEPGGGRFLEGEDLTIKVPERSNRADAATYVVQLRQPVALGTRAIVHLRLSLDDSADRSFARVSFSTAEPFRVLTMGCGAAQVPLTPAGSRYSREQALQCEADSPRLVLRFSSPPQALGPVEARNLVRLSPAVDNLTFAVSGTSLTVSGSFARETLYRVAVVPTSLSDTHGRGLDLQGESEVFLAFPRKAAFLQWGATSGIVERYGPQMAPLQGRGDERVDLRIHRVDPLDRTFWPFPTSAVRTDESQRPPGPGEEPAPHTAADRSIDEWQLRQHLSALGSPQVSTLIDLPLRTEGGAATFGLDLAAHLAKAGGKSRPGTYLVGIRRLGTGNERAWMRLQVTDLALATLEEPGAVVFAVTALSSGQPVPGARVRVEGSVSTGQTTWETLFEGTTGADGTLRWAVPGFRPTRSVEVRRLVVEKDGDSLVLDPDRAPDGFADNRWQPTRQTWLQWTHESLAGRPEIPRRLCHIFTERPVYRPEETVHIKGWVRQRFHGQLTPLKGSGTLLVEGPGDIVWRFPVELSPSGGFYQAFSADDLPTGTFTAALELPTQERIAEVAFRMEAYRLPEFEIHLTAPDRAPLDGELKVGLTATYYAGGRVAGRPVRWRVTQFPYAWQPKGQEGFLFSSDARFAGARRFEGSPRLEQEDVTDAEGGASLTLNPGAEATAQPRTYLVEATVTGADDQTVTAVQQVVAVPPFVLGLLAPRFLANATTIEPQVLVLGVDDTPLAGLPVTVRLKHRQWHSVLQASDFAQGQARYLTDVVDEQLSETTVTSGAAAVTVPLAIPTAGVYIVELEAADRLGRSQTVSVDLYAGGPEPQSWPKPATPVFTMSSDKPAYDPGDTAKLVLQSPFQAARALLVVEAPEGNQYRWVEVSGGAATVEVPVLPSFVPRLPVHAVLMRGRVAGSAPAAGSTADLGKPTTMAATTWLQVSAVSNRVEVTLVHPERALPGSEVEVTIRLSDPKGRPLPGEVTLWLVDAAVLALGREQRLDPLPDFIDPVRSRLTVRDTRNLAFGELAFAELPGGDEGEEGGLLERTTVRRNFKSVPFYNPAIQVGPDGVATVTVELPDNLTVFKLRAKAASGPDRFGVGVSQIAVRLPVIVQPALPRFVRPGDRFTAAAIGRVVEGEGGPGKAEWQVEGVTLDGGASRDLAWVPNQPLRIDFPVTVTTPGVDAEGTLSRKDVTFRVAVARTADGARDAFEVRLPIQPDRARMVVRQMQELESGKPLAVSAVPDPPRPGTVRRTLVLSEQAGLVRMAAGLSFLLDYPYGCTEQRISRTRAQVAMARLRGLLAQEGGEEALQRAVADTLDWIGKAVDGQGLVAYWPGGPGYVSLTAWTVQLLVEAKEAGYPVDPKLMDRLTRTLEQALRSDYSRFIDGESFAERSWALIALVQAGKAQPAYAAELARKAEYLDLEGTAEVLHAYARSGEADSPAARALTTRMWDGIVTRLHQGKEIYGGLQGRTTARSARILPSETRTVAEVTRAVIQSDASSPRLQVLVDGLVTLGRDDGWGSTNANAAALLALSELVKPPFAGAGRRQVRLRLGGDRTLDLGPETPLVTFKTNTPAAGEITLQPGAGRPVVARLETSWVPAADGSQVSPQANGFVVSREWLRQRGEDAPPDRIALAAAGTTVELAVGDVVEEHVQVVNPSDRAYVAVVTPLAAGCEPLNPGLATAPPEARPKGTATLAPTYVGFMDDHVAFYYDWLPKGTYDFYFRTRATVAGEYVQPPARAEMMYDGATWGQGAGARVVVQPATPK
ncbi:MAG: hypothetical protein MUF10_00540 [Thermoanaerobaculaceae bacterium]|nr:hypothetical protein [Thermoanaerobaculaceae bacterium]